MGQHHRVLLIVLLWACGVSADREEAADALLARDVSTARADAGKDDGEGGEGGEGGKAAGGALDKKMNMGVGGYQVIPNFVVTHGAKRTEVNDRVGCENTCDEQVDCRSFSYRAGDKRCLWSTKALHYSSRYVFHMKITKMDDMGKMVPTGKYKRFENIGYKEDGWRKIIADEAGCKDLCDKMSRCGAYTYREFDELCLMSGDGVKFDTDFMYYEKNMPPPKDKEAMKLESGKDEDEQAEDVGAGEIQKDTISEAAKIMTKKAKAETKQIKEEAKQVEGATKDTDDMEEREARMRDGMSKSMKERKEKMKGVKRIENTNAETGRIKGTAVDAAKEARAKAKSQIQTAFQEGYEKAQNHNRKDYDTEVEEIASKGQKSMEEHTGKVKSIAKMMETEQKEKEKKETIQKEYKEKAVEKEVKQKAVRKVRVDSLKEYAGDHILHQTLRAKNEDKLKRILSIAEKRRKREKTRKEMKIKKIALEKKMKHEKKVSEEKERKEKVNYESKVKEEERKHVEYARKQKEQSHKEIEKKEVVHKRKKKAEELKLKLEQAKKDATELGEKHKERESKVGQCEERRTKGQFVTYAYARTTAFTSAMSPTEKYGAEAEYNGMLRVQNGLGNKKQAAYLKFSAQGNKIVDEESEEEEDLGESASVEEHTNARREFKPEDAVPDTSENVVAAAHSNEIIEKSKVDYIARRRWVDRRRRWSVEPVVSDRRRDALASRRRELSERRRRTLGALETSIKKAELKIFKFGGPAAKLVVKSVQCSWERPTLDYASAAKLAVPNAEELSTSLLEVQEGETQELSAQDTAQTGYWGQDHKQAHKELGDTSEASSGGQKSSRLPVPVMPVPIPYTADRRRYIDRRRRFPEPKPGEGETEPTAPPPTQRRRRFVGQTAGTVYAPEGNNMWLSIALSSNIIGVMRAADKLCFEISGGGPTEPIVLGSERSTNKPYLQLNVMGEAGARRRRCSQVVALDSLTKMDGGTAPARL